MCVTCYCRSVSNPVSVYRSDAVFIAGQQRSRMLATLFKDERCQQLPTYGILEKMYMLICTF